MTTDTNAPPWVEGAMAEDAVAPDAASSPFEDDALAMAEAYEAGNPSSSALPPNVVPLTRPSGSRADEDKTKADADMDRPISSLRQLRAVNDYLQRIAADPRNFKLALVVEREGKYAREVGRVVFAADGKVTASRPEFAPTEAEQALIAEAFKTAKFPVHQPLTALGNNLPPELKGLTHDHLFEFHDEQGQIVMLQQRIDKENGDKAYVPWTFWTDGQWRRMEPDGPLPFWGLDQLKTHGVVYLHEGAKAAQNIRRQLREQNPKACPWLADMKYAAHVGWIGGALAVNRSDFGLFRRMGCTRVYIVCDHDQPGEDAAGPISRALNLPTEAVIFDANFPDGFDLGDAFPKKLFNERGEYTGPGLDDCRSPATWATDIRPNPVGEGRPLTVARPHFIENVRYVDNLEAFVDLRNLGHRRRRDAFNSANRAYSDVVDLAAVVLKHPSVRVDRLAYIPGSKAGVLGRDSERVLNVWEETVIKPVSIKPGDAGIEQMRPFVDYMTGTFPIERERFEVERFIATLIAAPGNRIHYALVLMSEMQGVGKSTLGRAILTPLVGPWNVSNPPEAKVTGGSFNDFLAEKTLVQIDECDPKSAKKTYEALKPLITEPTVRVNAKYQPEFEMELHATFLITSNSKRPMAVEFTDRRLFVPTVTEEARPHAYWREFHEWLDGDGLGLIRQWAINFVKTHGAVLPGQIAPPSAAKDELILASMSDGERLAYELGLAAMARAPEQVVFSLPAIRTWVAGRRGIQTCDERLEKQETLARGLRRAGMTVWAGMNRVKIGDDPTTVAMNWPGVPKTLTWVKDLKEFERSPIGAWPMGLGFRKGEDEPL